MRDMQTPFGKAKAGLVAASVVVGVLVGVLVPGIGGLGRQLSSSFKEAPEEAAFGILAAPSASPSPTPTPEPAQQPRVVVEEEVHETAPTQQPGVIIVQTPQPHTDDPHEEPHDEPHDDPHEEPEDEPEDEPDPHDE